MAWGEFGNQPINSTSSLITAPSTSTLIAEIDSTQLGTQNFVAGQSRNYQVTYILGGDTGLTWQVGTCSSTALNAGVDEFFPKTATLQSAQFTLQHTLLVNYRIRARLVSTGTAPNCAAYISAVPLT